MCYAILPQYIILLRSSILPGSETWPIRKENEMALQWAEMRMVRWMCGVKIVPSKGLIERLGLDDIISVLQQNRLRWYGHVLRKEDNDCLKKCMEYEVEGARPRGRQKRTWREIVEKDCQTRKLKKEDATDILLLYSLSRTVQRAIYYGLVSSCL